MARLVVAMLIVSLLSIASSHELCTNSLDPFNVQLSFCAEYSGHSCCTTERDAQIAAEYNAIVPQAPFACDAFLRRIFCAECDPWSAHLYGAEVNVQASSTPALCDSYCVDLYRACGNITLNWRGFLNGASPFKSNPINVQYPNERLFCKIYAAPSTSTVCYAGAKVLPPTPMPADQDSTGTCIERLGDNSLDPTKMIVSVVSAHDDSNYIYVQFKRGEIQIWDRDTGTYVTTFMTLPFPILNSDGEAGFTSLVFHPDYKNNGRFFVHYSTLNFSVIGCPQDANGNDLCGTSQGCANDVCVADHVSVVSEVRLQSVGFMLNKNPDQYRRSATDPLKADLTSERRLIIQAQPFRIHNCGQLLFGPDHLLYVMWGDGGSRFDPYHRAQDTQTFLGKLLRIDVDIAPDAGLAYHIPQDNPFYGRAEYANHWEIYATGFRHSWRCSFDRNNMSNLFCADVGQERREEVNLVKKGANYGWSMFEGTLKAPNYPNQTQYVYEYPIIEYEHYDLGGSPAVIGGFVSYSTRDPCLQDKYVFGDWQGVVWAAAVNSSGLWHPRQTLLFLAPATTNPSYWAGIGDLFAFGEDDRADIYLLAQTGVYRIVERSRCNLPASCTSTAPPLLPTATPRPTQSDSPTPTFTSAASPPTTTGTVTVLTLSTTAATSSPSSVTSTAGTSRPSTATAGRVSGAASNGVSSLLVVVALLTVLQTVEIE